MTGWLAACGGAASHLRAKAQLRIGAAAGGANNGMMLKERPDSSTEEQGYNPFSDFFFKKLDLSFFHGYFDSYNLLLTPEKAMEKKYSIAEAKNRLPAIVHETEKDHPIFLLRRGRPVAVLLSTREYERLQAHSRKDFWSALTCFRENTLLQSTEVIEDADFRSLRDRSPGRVSELS